MGAVTYEDTDVLCTENLAFPSTRIFSNKDSMVKFYSFRYWMVRSLTTTPTFLPKWMTLRKSALELFLILAAFVITLTISQEWLNGRDAGQLAEDMACFMIISAFRNNILTIFLGVSWERAIQVHKVAGILTIFLGISHMIITMRKKLYIVKTGIAMISLFTATALSYLLKKRYFEVFYAFHIMSYISILGVGYRHGARMLVFTAIVWGVDWLARIFFGYHKTEADVTALPNDVVKISFKKNFKYSPGQFCFVSIPSLSYFQFHPFSISSAPHEEEVSFNIKAVGNWTKDLQRLASTANESDVEGGRSKIHGEGKGNAVTVSNCVLTLPKKITVAVEGPYGLPSIDLISGYYSVFILVGGGIGVTPIQSIYLHLAHKYKANPLFLKKCVLVWSVRDESLISNFPNLLVTVPASSSTNGISVQPMSSELPLDTESAEFHSPQPVDSIEGVREVKKTNNVLGDAPFHKLIHLTSSCDVDKNNSHRNSQTSVTGGRPDYYEIFSQIALLCVQESHARVAVVACGPPSLVDSVEKLCARRHEGVAFDLHKETFDL